MIEKTDKQQAIFAKITELKDRLADSQALLDWLHADCQQLSQERDAAIERAEKAEAALNQSKEIAEEVSSILADDHHELEAPCRFAGAEVADVGCLACLAQERLADIKSLTPTPKSIGEKKTESKLRNALKLYSNPDNWRFTHDKENNLLWITSLGPDYAIEILNEVSRESSEEKEKETAHALPS